MNPDQGNFFLFRILNFMADELFRDYCMIKIDMIEIIERKKKNNKKNPPSTFARVKLQHLAREQIAIKTTHTYYRQEFFCFKVNFDDILDQGQN